MDPNASNKITPQEYQQFLQWRQQQQQQRQAPPPPPPQQPMAFQSQYAPMVVSQRLINKADRAFLTFMESRFEHNLNQMVHNLPQYSGGPSQVQQPQFNQLQGFAAPQYGGAPFGAQQSQVNQPQGFAAPQCGGGPSQVQQPQFNQLQGFTAPQYGGGPFGTQQSQYNQPQGFVAPQSTVPAAAAPQQWHAGFEARRPSAFQFTPEERAPSAFEKLALPQDGGTPVSHELLQDAIEFLY